LNVNSMIADVRDELVGRERESSLLIRHRREAADGRGRIVLIRGDAGVGKSRLLRHFEAGLAGGRPATAFTRCIEFVQTPLAPLRDLLQQLEGRGSSNRDAATHALIQRLAFERDVGAMTATLPSGALFEAIDGAFVRRELRGTVVLLIEDIHWADRSTLAYLTYLADRIERRRMLVVATYRSDEVGPGHPRLAEFASLVAKRSVSQVKLAPLDERSLHALIGLALPHAEALDPTTIGDIARRSQGNPFFAEELVKSALERGSGDDAHELPLSIRGAILARAALLSEDALKILSLAAVLGERFSINRLVALHNGDREDVLAALERARALQLVYEQPSAPDRLTFRHALTQEVLYGELLSERVRPLHETIALEIEQRAERSVASVELAHHWRRAGDLQRASTYAELAGDHASAIGAMADAIVYYERALVDRKEGSASAALLHKLGVSFGALNQLNNSIPRLRRAGDLYWDADDFEGFAANASVLGAQLYNAGDTAAATDLFRRTIDALGAKVPAEALGLLRARIAYNCVAALDFDSALSFLDELHEPIADPMTATYAYQARFKVAAMRGELDDWRTYGERALEGAKRLSDDGTRLRHTHCQIALDAVALGEIDRAREHFRAAVPAGRQRSRPGLTLAAAASSLEHTLRGDFTTAATLLGVTRGTQEQSYAILVHIKSAQFALGICSGDDARLRRDDSESFLHYGVERGMKLALGLLGGPYAWALGLRGELDEAAAWIRHIARSLPGPHRFLFAYLAAAQYGARDDVLAMRPALAEAAARPRDRVNTAVLGLFDAFAAERGILTMDVRARALDAAAAFDVIGWPWLAARGYELGGEPKRAQETYRILGAAGDLRRIEVGRPDAATAILSPREREVAELVATGHSNDEIAQTLHISLRTAEKHVSSALNKLHLRSRLQLGRLLARS
jgi:DNA-binding CsgD family transcriptional regulator